MEKAKLFRIALTVAGLSLRDWAAEQGVSEVHVYKLLSEQTVSARLTEAMDRFIAEQLHHLSLHLTSSPYVLGEAA